MKGCVVYIDDICIFSVTFDEHLEKLDQVFEKLYLAGLKLKPPKHLFMLDSVIHLGHKVSDAGVEPDPSKIEDLKGWRSPTTVHEVRQFLGFSGYYRRFIRNYARIAKPLTDLLAGISAKTNKNAPVEWG